MVLAVCLAGVALRAVAVPHRLGDTDAVNLARGLAGFDLFTQSPHFPGYPVLIALSGLLYRLGVGSECWALSLPGILLWPFGGMLMFLGLRRVVAEPAALGAVAFASLAPGAVVTAGWPGSDGLGLSLLAAAVGMLVLRRNVGLVLLGLLLGVRLSWWPIAGAVLAFCLNRRLSAWRGTLAFAALGTCMWLLPMLVMFGALPLVELALGFGKGHLHSWGGTSLSAVAPMSDRILRLWWGVWHAGLGGLWTGSVPLSAFSARAEWAGLAIAATTSVALLQLATTRRRPLWARVALWLCLPYLVWLVGFQNVTKTRHLVPLLPLVGACIGSGIALGKGRVPAAALLGVAMLYVSAGRAVDQGRIASPAVALSRWLPAAHEPTGLLLMAGQEARVLEHYAPMYRVVRPDTPAVLVEEVHRAHRLGIEVWITSRAPGFARVAAETEELGSFRFPASVRPHDAELHVARYRPDEPPQLALAGGSP